MSLPHSKTGAEDGSRPQPASINEALMSKESA